MPVKIDVLEFKCFNQLRNGENFDANLSEFTPNLVGNVGEKVKVSYKVNIEQSAFTEGSEEWQIIEITDDVDILVERSSGSFLEDSIQVGDIFAAYGDWANKRNGDTGNPGHIGEVTFLSLDGRQMRYTVQSFIPPVSSITPTTGTNIGYAFPQRTEPANFNGALFLRFGLIGNDETFNFISKTTEAQQIYYVGGISEILTQKFDGEPLGSNRDWVTGSMNVEVIGVTPDFRGAQYLIEHEFVLNPFYTLAFREALENGTVPDFLAGDNSLKYAAEFEFRKTLTNTGSAKIGKFDNLPGFVGWYGENFNGLNPDYAVVSVSYEDAATGDPLNGININLATKATIVVQDINGPITDYSCAAYLYKALASEDEYIETRDNLLENFLYKSGVVSSPATTGTNISTSLVSGNLVIEFTVSYAGAELLRLTTDDEFVLAVQVEDPTIAAGNSNRMMLLADLANYVDINFLEDFINVGGYGFLTHGQDLAEDTVQTDPTLSNEDGIVLAAFFGANVARNVIMNNISLQLLAYNPVTGESFQLDSYELNIDGTVNNSGVQLINIETLRGYPLPEGDEFNLVKLTTNDQVGDFRNYALVFGQKITWQDWILNQEVDNVFFDATKPNNNQNEKASNYSGLEGYDIRLALVINVSGVDDLGRTVTGDFIHYGGVITVNDYDESEDTVTGVIQTFDLESGQSLAGNILYNGKDTLLRAVFQNASAMNYAIHRIEPSQNQGDGILELSSVVPSVTSNLLKPLAGETGLKFSNDGGGQITTESIIDGSLIQEGVQYKLSARIGQIPTNLVNGFTFTVDTNASGVSANDKFQLPFYALGTYSCFVDKGNGDPLIEITGGEDSATLLDYSSSGPGVYQVQIFGTIQGFNFFDGGDRLKMLDISQWGTLQFLEGGAFDGASNLTVSATDVPDFSLTTSLAETFRNTAVVGNSSFNSWDVSNIVNFQSLFNGSNFNADISLWDMSNATNISFMFGDTPFNQNIGIWDISNVTTLQQTFFNCTNFNQNLGDWNVSNVTSFVNTFGLCTSFNNGGSSDINNWVLSSSGSVDMRAIFSGCSAFNQPLGGWSNTNRISDLTQAFLNCSAFNQNLGTWLLTNCSSLNSCFSGCTVFNNGGSADINNWDVSNTTDFNACFRNTAFNQNISSWDVSSATSMSDTFAFCPFNQNIAGWNVSNVTNMARMFQQNTAFNQPIGAWNTGNVTTTERMFASATGFNQDLGAWDVTSLINAAIMFNSVTLSTANYDSLLTGWESQAVQNNIVFNGGNSTYTLGGAAETARTALINDHNWTITDGGGI